MAATFFTLLALEVFMLQRSFAQSTPDTLRIPEHVDSADRTHYNRAAYNCISGKIVIKETGTSRKGMYVQLYDAERNFIGETFSTEDGSFLLVIPDTANTDGIFYVKVEKEKIKNRRYITHFRMAIKKIRPDQRKDIIIEIDRDRRIRSWPFQQRIVITGRFI